MIINRSVETRCDQSGQVTQVKMNQTEKPKFDLNHCKKIRFSQTEPGMGHGTPTGPCILCIQKRLLLQTPF